MAGQVASPVTETGRYTFSLRVIIPGQADQIIAGYTYVVVRDSSPFGAGWTFSVTDELFDIPADADGPAGQLRAYGTGEWRFYRDLGGGAFQSPAADNGTLVRNGDNSFTYTTPSGVKTNWNASGYQTSIVSTDGKETISFSYTAGLLTGMTAVDGATTTFSYDGGYLSSIMTAGPRTFSLTNLSGDLMEIMNANGGVRTFGYDGGHRLTSELFGILQNQWRYSTSNGRLDEITLGSGASPTRYAVTPSIVEGLAALVKGKPKATTVDARNMVTQWRFDGLGRPLTLRAADGGISTWGRDAAGRVTSFIDPLGRVTKPPQESQVGRAMVGARPIAVFVKTHRWAMRRRRARRAFT